MVSAQEQEQGPRAPRCAGRPVYIRSLATYVPPRVLTNADLEKMVETSDEWILQRTGIRERRVASDDQSVTTLAIDAALP